MSDNSRQGLGDKAQSALKPDSQKSLTEQAGDSVKGTADSLASTLQPQSEKSTTQKAGDAVSGNSNQNDKSMLQSAKDAVGLGQK